MRCKLFRVGRLLWPLPCCSIQLPWRREFTAQMGRISRKPHIHLPRQRHGTLHLDLDKKARTINFKGGTFSGWSSPGQQQKESHIHLGEIHQARRRNRLFSAPKTEQTPRGNPQAVPVARAAGKRDRDDPSGLEM